MALCAKKNKPGRKQRKQRKQRKFLDMIFFALFAASIVLVLPGRYSRLKPLLRVCRVGNAQGPIAQRIAPLAFHRLQLGSDSPADPNIPCRSGFSRE
jgi:hypothetical protein